MRSLIVLASLVAGCSARPAAKPMSLSETKTCDGEHASESRASLALERPTTRLQFEVAMSHGLIPVHRDECGRVEIVADCHVDSSAAYRYESHEPQSSSEEARGRGLHVESVTGGAYRADTAALTDPKLVGAGCGKATHVVTAMTVGAFAVTKVKGSGHAMLSGAGGSSANDSEVVSSDGKADACKEQRRDEPAPACRALIDVELQPIKHGAKDAAGVPGTGKQGIETGIIAPQ